MTASGNCTLYAALGDNFSIPLEHNLREDDEFSWKINSTIVHKKKNREQIKTTAVSSSGSLQLINLKMSDSANYSVVVFDKNGQFVDEYKEWLCVIGEYIMKQSMYICVQKQYRTFLVVPCK